MTTISNGTTTITPRLVLGYAARQQSRNVVHEVIGRRDPDVTLRPAGTRTGTLRLLFLTEAAAASAFDDLGSADVWTLLDADVSTIGMAFVVDGQMEVSLDDRTITRWTVSVEYREVLP
jgi:hypothetical protein